MRPFTAMGDVHSLTPLHVSALVTRVFPVSPSTPTSLPPLVYQTMGSAVPSVVVESGPIFDPESAAHQATDGLGGEPGAISTDMTTLPLGPPIGHIAPLSVPRMMCTPLDDVYQAGAVWIAIAPPAIGKSTLCPAMPPRFAGSS